MTGEEYLNLIGKTYDLPKKELPLRINTLLEYFFNSTFDKNKLVSKYSAGMKKKIEICSAVLYKPDILFLDEPFTGLDPSSQKLLVDYLKNLKKESNSLIILSSHNLSFVSEICDRIILIENGKIIKDEAVSNTTLNELKEYFENQIKNQE